MPTTDPTPPARRRDPECVASLVHAGGAHATVEREPTATTVAFNDGRLSVRLVDADRGLLRLLLTDALAALDAVDAQNADS